MNEEKLGQLMQCDFSVGTEAFRDALLERCLNVLNSDDGITLTEEQLDMLAAAGDPYGALTAHNNGESFR